jgi:hypothetical protein
MTHRKLKTTMLVPILLLVAVFAPGASAATIGAADRAMEHRVERRFPLQTSERLISVRCRRARGGFSCLYGLRATYEEAVEIGEEGGEVEHGGVWAYSGLGFVHVRGGRLYPETIGPLWRGGRFAP